MTRVILLVLVSFSFGGLIFARTIRSLPPSDRRTKWIKFWIYLLIVALVVALARVGPNGYCLLLTIIAIAGAAELWLAQAQARGAGRCVPRWIGAVYLPLAASAIAGVCHSHPETTLFLFAVVATFDGASQVSGQLVGGPKLVPGISPGKTVAGFVGGSLTAIFVAMYLSGLVGSTPIGIFPRALVVVAVALAGDLSASWVKRRAGLKDFSGMIPGHGGVLDRFDGFIPNCALLVVPVFGGGA